MRNSLGANHGSFSIIASELVGENGTIAAVEPQAQLAPLVEKSLAANAKCDYKVYEMACGDRDGVIDFYIPEWSSGSAGVFPSFSAKFKHQTISVPLKKFDEAVNWQNFKGRTFIKLDVEGSELAFLRGASKAIRELQPNILMEINPWSMNAANTTIDQIVREFEGLGYTEFIEIDNIDQKKKLAQMEGERPHNIILLSPKQIAVEV
ncbi:MAG: FkbM family methyltransferase [Hydrococcus sp. Prado102]|jgi:FkbM family methyltransferase|nr:FkbM family methyltransferase [Hydrococcus sp. Prado102]